MTPTAGERAWIERSLASSSPRDADGPRWIERLAATAGLLCVVWWATDAIATAQFQHDAAVAFEEERAAPAPAGDASPAPHHRSVARRTSGPPVLGRIEIPAAKMSAMIAAGTAPHTLDLAVGHVPGTALPGESGRCVLAGHRDTFFRGLGRVRPGDRIRITTRTGVREYRVTSARIVSRRSVSALQAGPPSGVVLVTCYPFQFVGPAPLRYIIYAV